jgi:hypothetical protein
MLRRVSAMEGRPCAGLKPHSRLHLQRTKIVLRKSKILVVVDAKIYVKPGGAAYIAQFCASLSRP